ncbi:MAG TPA: hypothetical protein VMT75_12885 [Candidatus Saccharimonadales bacterium]|nr:hypothetical protein [Candidatus Saccharimonadales bacterium]
MNDHEKLYVLGCRAIAEQMRLAAHVMMRRKLSVQGTIDLLHERLDSDFGGDDGVKEFFKAMESFVHISAPEAEVRMHFHEQLRHMAMELEQQASKREDKK